MMKRIVIVLTLAIWPISLFIANTPNNFIHYVFPFSEPKFAIFPLLFVLFYFKFRRPLLIFISVILLILFFRPFWGQTVFIKDYNQEQKILQEQKLYSSVFIARLFQNKARIPIEKFINNFFAITDPGNYFFGFAPRQITIDNQNLKKFPFLSLPFLLIGLYFLNKQNHSEIITIFLISAVINLSLLTNFDRNDFVLWIPLSFIILNGLVIFDKKFKYAKYYYLFFIAFSLIEIIRIFIK